MIHENLTLGRLLASKVLRSRFIKKVDKVFAIFDNSRFSSLLFDFFLARLILILRISLINEIIKCFGSTLFRVFENSEIKFENFSFSKTILDVLIIGLVAIIACSRCFFSLFLIPTLNFLCIASIFAIGDFSGTNFCTISNPNFLTRRSSNLRT